MFCEKCGAKNSDTSMYCEECGARLTGQPQNTWSGNNNNAGVQYVVKNEVPEDYKPIGMWGYLGYEILFSIPLVGFILLLVFSFGGTKNVNLRNFARSYFCFLIIAVVLILIIIMAGGIAAVAMY